jgi:hypothetical protein
MRVILLNERGEVAECTSPTSSLWIPAFASGPRPSPPAAWVASPAVLLEEIRDPEIAIAEKPLLPADLTPRAKSSRFPRPASYSR